MRFQQTVYQIVTITIMTILAPRMLINIRTEIYRPGAHSSPSDMRSLSWDASPVVATSNECGTIEP